MDKRLLARSTVLAGAALLAAGAAMAQSPARLRPARMLEITNACRPAYPADALRAQAQGTTLLLFGIDASGQVVRSAIERSSGTLPEHRSLDQAALSALARCPFVAATDGEGRPIAGNVEVSYAWDIHPPAPGEVAGPAPRAAVLDAEAPSCHPAYPPAAATARAQGVSTLWFRIDAQGRVVESHVVRPSGPTPEHALLDRTALDALARCPIRPGQDESGRTVETVLQMDYRWALQ
jgi:TonB family protein